MTRSGSDQNCDVQVIGGSEPLDAVIEIRDSNKLALAPRSFTPADKVVICYFAIMSLLVLGSLQGTEHWGLLLALHLSVIAAIVWMSGLSLHSRVGGVIRGWYALLLVPLSFKELEYLVPRINPVDLDHQLAAMDLTLLGVHPTIWLERITHPALTELFQLAYITYYFFPLALGIPLWRRLRIGEFHTVLFGLVLAFYLSYLGYIAVPAIGPRFILNGNQTIPLQGVLFFQTIRDTLDWAEGITRDCFPSGHTAIALVVVYYASRFNRRLFWVLLPIASALIFSTVYLRYHYVVDVAAGVLLAVLVVVISKPLYRALGGCPVGEVKQSV